MKDRILSVAIALSLIAVLFIALPSTTEAAVVYTGDVQTTDDAGDAKEVYFQDDGVYVRVETYYQGDASNETFRVELRTQSGVTRDSFEAETGEAGVGVYESWSATPNPESLQVGFGFTGEIIVYDIVLLAWDAYWSDWVEVDRTQIIVRNDGLFLEPSDADFYYPGQEVSLTLVTSHEEDFYVQIVNDTWEDFENWTSLEVWEDPDDDGVWHTTWVIDEDMPDGEYAINVRAEDNDNVWYTVYVDIAKYLMLVDCNFYYVLPGQTVTILYDVVNMANMTHYTGVEIEWNALWIDNDDENATDSGTLDGSSGTFDFTVAEDIALYSEIDMMFWANESDDRSSEADLSMTVGSIGADMDVDAGPYNPGDDVRVNVEAWVGIYGTGSDDLPGAEVDLVVSKNGTELSQYGTSGMVTDVTGEVDYEFVLDNDAVKGTYVVKMTLTYLDLEIERMATFEVVYGGYLEVEFSKDVYYSGQTATLYFTVIWNGVEANATSVYYVLYGDYGLLGTGNSTIGTASFPIPDDYVGDIGVEAITVVDGYYLYGAAEASVHIADVVLYPLAEYYRAGDTVTWAYELATAMTNGTIRYAIVDDMGVKVASDDLPFAKSNSFDYEVPEMDPATRYTATVTVDDGLGHIVSDSATVWLFAEHELRIWLDSSAGYTSKAYEPGDTIVFGYSIEAIGVAELDVYRISFYGTDEYIDGNVLVTGDSGTFEYSLHDNVNDGTYLMIAELQNPVSGDWLSSDSASFAVKSEQSLWDKSVGGLSVFETTVLLLLLIMVILLVLVPMIKSRMDAKPKEHVPRSMEQEPPPPAEIAPEEPES